MAINDELKLGDDFFKKSTGISPLNDCDWQIRMILNVSFS
jgi:hypothetical protein